MGRVIPWVFHRNAQPIKEFTVAWQRVCRRAGLPALFFHDLRHTAVRNMIRAEIPERVVMQIAGHKTRAIFDRYNIVREGDLQEAARKLSNIRFPAGPILGTGTSNLQQIGKNDTMEVPNFTNAEGRTRTDTAVARPRILSPVRLPIPPPRHAVFSKGYMGLA